MQNDVLKNNIAPWQEKGRWYHGVLKCSTGLFIPEETDDFLLTFNVYDTGSGYYAIYGDNSKYSLVESVLIPRNRVPVAVAYTVPKFRVAVTGNIGVPVGIVTTSDTDIDVYVFATI